MKALAMALCVALPAYADDAPRQLCLEPEQRIALAKKLTALEAENASLKESLADTPSTGFVVLMVVAGIVVGGAATYAVVKVAK